MNDQFNISSILSIIDSVLNDFDFATELNYVLSGLCSLVILWHFSSVTIQNLLRGGEGFSFDILRKPIFYLIMVIGWPTLQDFIVNAADAIAFTVTEQQQQAYDINSNNFKKIDETMLEFENEFDTAQKIGLSESDNFIDRKLFEISLLDDKIMIKALQAIYQTTLMFDSFLYVMFYFFSKLWLKITLIGGSIAFTVSLLVGGWTVLINWAKTVLSVSLWIPVSGLLMTLINSILVKVLNDLTPEFPSDTDVNGFDIDINTFLGKLIGFILMYIILTLIFFAFKLIVLSKVPSIISGWLSGGNSGSGGFMAAFVPVAVAKTAAKSVGGATASSGGFTKK